MAIHVTCECGKAIKADPALAGKRGKCPYCGAKVAIPPISGKPVVASLAGSPPDRARSLPGNVAAEAEIVIDLEPERVAPLDATLVVVGGTAAAALLVGLVAGVCGTLVWQSWFDASAVVTVNGAAHERAVSENRTNSPKVDRAAREQKQAPMPDAAPASGESGAIGEQDAAQPNAATAEPPAPDNAQAAAQHAPLPAPVAPGDPALPMFFGNMPVHWVAPKWSRAFDDPTLELHFAKDSDWSTVTLEKQERLAVRAIYLPNAKAGEAAKASSGGTRFKISRAAFQSVVKREGTGLDYIFFGGNFSELEDPAIANGALIRINSDALNLESLRQHDPIRIRMSPKLYAPTITLGGTGRIAFVLEKQPDDVTKPAQSVSNVVELPIDFDTIDQAAQPRRSDSAANSSQKERDRGEKIVAHLLEHGGGRAKFRMSIFDSEALTALARPVDALSVEKVFGPPDRIEKEEIKAVPPRSSEPYSFGQGDKWYYGRLALFVKDGAVVRFDNSRSIGPAKHSSDCPQPTQNEVAGAGEGKAAEPFLEVVTVQPNASPVSKQFVLQINCEWKRAKNPSLVLLLQKDPKVEIEKIHPVQFQGDPELLVLTNIALAEGFKSPFTGTIKLIPTGAFEVLAYSNCLHKVGGCITGTIMEGTTPIAAQASFLLLDRWAISDERLQIEPPPAYFDSGGTIRVLFMDGAELVWEKHVKWPRLSDR